ncbi:MAG: L-glutamate gamma-semialdehyde dehydrogenase [Exilispira sp.]|jgi:1-pyrroline-5-carboxylate dehydrogenase|nr:L-glutamate gamma-semialdehyde dehydrogenase [Exilispira sp.]
MSDAIFKIPQPVNEPIKEYRKGSPEKIEIKKKLQELKNQNIEIPLIIDGKEIRTGITGKCVLPHDHHKVIGTYHKATSKEISMAIEAALKAKKEWENMSWHHRAAIFLKAADLLSGPYRALVNAATMLNLSKTIFQAEIDSACELSDFFRFNAYYLSKIYEDQPYSPKYNWNRMEYRPLEGFIFAVTPFNFLSIGGNLPSTPAIVGNTVLWKPASSAVYPAYFIMKILMEAGLPPGVINFIPANGAEIGDIVFSSKDFAGVHFTGSTSTFQSMWKSIGLNIANYRSYPRIVGETGGKDFIFVHNSSDPYEVATACVRGAYEYQGQKCSAASRAYLPSSLANKIIEIMLEQISRIKMGDPEDFTNFMTAVIDESAFNTISSYIEIAKRESSTYRIITGGKYDKSKGYFIEPTLIESKDPKSKLMQEEIFGPVLTIYVYDDKDLEKTVELCNETSSYGLTGAIFARDRNVIVDLEKKLRHAAGNFYINDKPTGAVVGQQPFGGARASGTNDKAGSYLNLLRWISARSIKENFIPPKDFIYPFMEED